MDHGSGDGCLSWVVRILVSLIAAVLTTLFLDSIGWP